MSDLHGLTCAENGSAVREPVVSLLSHARFHPFFFRSRRKGNACSSASAILVGSGLACRISRSERHQPKTLFGPAKILGELAH